jgi:hypothetical protein
MVDAGLFLAFRPRQFTDRQREALAVKTAVAEVRQAVVMQSMADAIRADLAAGDAGYRAAGEKFIAQKLALKGQKGAWTAWLKAEGFEERQTQRLMQYAKTDAGVAFAEINHPEPKEPSRQPKPVMLADILAANDGSLLGPCQFPGCTDVAEVAASFGEGIETHKTCEAHGIGCNESHPDDCPVCEAKQAAYVKASNRAAKSNRPDPTDWREFRDWDALREIVKRGFLALAMERHPDHGGTQEAFEHLRMGQNALNRMIDSREEVS